MNGFSGERTKALLFGALGLIFALVLGFFIGSSDFQPLLLGALVGAGLFIWFGTGQWFWPVTIASSYLGGTFPVLGGSFTPFQILMGIGIAKFLVEEVIMRRKSFTKVDRSLLIAMFGFMLIITAHGIHDRFGMRFLGSDVWGGRNYVNVYVGLIAFFVIQSVSVNSKLWNKLPYLVLAVTSFDLFIAAITTIFPSLILKIYPFYSAVGVGGIAELTRGTEDITGRIGSFGNFGNVLVAIVLSSIPIWRLFTLGNFVKLVAFGLGSLAVLFSGFRSAVAGFIFAILAAGYRDLRMGVLLLIPLFAAVLFGISAINSTVVTLPKQMQRAIVFMPGDWDQDQVRDARASNDFRDRVWTLWSQDYFPKQPLFGRGFGFKSEWADVSINDPGRSDYYEQMVEVGNIHNGLFAAIDAVGLVGTVFFIWWTVILLWRALHVSFAKTNPAGFALRFIALQLAVAILSFWFGAVTLGTFLPGAFASAGLFLRLWNPEERKAQIGPARPDTIPSAQGRSLAPV